MLTMSLKQLQNPDKRVGGLDLRECDQHLWLEPQNLKVLLKSTKAGRDGAGFDDEDEEDSGFFFLGDSSRSSSLGCTISGPICGPAIVHFFRRL